MSQQIMAHSTNDVFAEDPGKLVMRKTLANPDFVEKDKSIELDEEEAKSSLILNTDNT